MNYETFIYEAAVLLLILALVYMGITIKKLTRVVKEEKSIWIFPVLASGILLLSLAAHIYASFILLPGMEEKIKLLSDDDILFNREKLSAVKASISAIKGILVQLKAFSFTCFFLASVLCVLATGVYMRWISK